jgi:hypothetical protein
MPTTLAEIKPWWGNSTLLDSFASPRFNSTPNPSPPVTRTSPYLRAISWYLLYIFNTLLTSSYTPYRRHHCRFSPSLSLLAIVPIHSLQTAHSTANFCSTANRHPHASIDGLHPQSFLHCLLTQTAHARVKISRHVLHHRLYHLRHNRES